MVARIARIPPKTVSSNDRDVLKNLDRNLKLVIYGQDKAIDTLASSIKMARSGLGDQRKPVGSFLFAGPTGVGKTEVTRQLALALGVELVRFDMSEYMERHTVSRLIGAPPGYVGFDQGGLLTEAITKHPHCVLLLDEIEKAHPDVFNLLLQVMDHGTLTDNNGRKADFRHVVIVMTTNAGAADMSRTSVGFVAQDHATDGMEAIKKMFAPEFRNRLDAVVQFAPLDERTIQRVVDKLLVEVETQLETKGVQLHIDEEARGVDREAGLRPEDGCPADGPHHPGAHQAAARGRAAVRQPGARGPCLRQRERGRDAQGRVAQRGRTGAARVIARLFTSPTSVGEVARSARVRARALHPLPRQGRGRAFSAGEGSGSSPLPPSLGEVARPARVRALSSATQHDSGRRGLTAPPSCRSRTNYRSDSEMAFQISGLPFERFSHLLGLDAKALQAEGVIELPVDAAHAFPCRITLRDAEPGEHVLLLSFEHQPATSPYRAAGPIFVRRDATPTHIAVDTVPEQQRRRLLSVRAYDERDWIVAAEVTQGSELESVIERFFADPQVRYLHLHNARPGCYAARVDRA